MCKHFIRKLIAARENETIEDAVDRHLKHISKWVYRSPISAEMLKNAIESCGLECGDTVLVHAAWRSMFNYKEGPESFIKILLDIVGENGTVLMPCYGPDQTFLDVENTPSCAGILSEVFRKMPDVKRSSCTHFSVAGKGLKANYYLEDHIRSRYGFDEFSPCYKICQEENAKVLFIGLGRVPTKVSIFHCAGAVLRESDEKMKRLLSKEYEGVLVVNGEEIKRKMFIRLAGHKNKHKVFRMIVKSLKHKRNVKVSNVDIVIIKAKEGYEKALEYAKNGVYCYKNMWRL